MVPTLFAILVGTRPEAIKIAPVVRELRQRGLYCNVISSGQHGSLAAEALADFGITADIDLHVMTTNQEPIQVLARVLAKLRPVLKRLRPDWLLVQGDTTTALAGALVAHHLGVRLAHVEAGLRTHNLCAPFPEEANRRLVDAISELCFAPTETAVTNLRRENIGHDRIVLTGNTIVDAVIYTADRPSTPRFEDISRQIRGRRLVLVTTHRRENFGQPLNNVLLSVRDLASEHKRNVRFVVTVHPNPAVSGPIRKLLHNQPGVLLVAPLDHRTFVQLLRRSWLVLTDSGGVQEEAPTFGVPVLILREATERPEAIDFGSAQIVGTDGERIEIAVRALLYAPRQRRSMVRGSNPFGDGHAAIRIVDALLHCRLDSGDRTLPSLGS